MISFPLLGRYGRLGNQMFQYAATYTIAKKNNTSPLFPSKGHDLNCFNLNEKYFTSNPIEIVGMYKENELDFSFDPTFFNLPNNVGILGYFQNLNYIVPFGNEIKNHFSFNSTIINAANQLLEKKIKNAENSIKVSLHVRRGDYLNIQHVLPVCSIDYYRVAIEKIKLIEKKISIIVFSDDISWCKENFQNENFLFFESNENPAIDLAAMTLCNHHIIANSSFSWWGAWLSKNKNTVIRPKLWFGPNGPKNENICPTNWIAI